MALRRFTLTLATAVIAGGVALGASPAIAQGTPQATVYKFSLPGSVTLGSEKFTLPGDVLTRKSRGGKSLGKVALADMVVTMTKQAAKGYSVGGLITIKGATRQLRGLPVLSSDGTVKIRVAQGRASRSVVVPRGGGTASYTVCPPGTIPAYTNTTPPKFLCYSE